MGKTKRKKINNLLQFSPVNFEQVPSSLQLFKVKPKPSSILPEDDCQLCTVQWAHLTCLSGICTAASVQTNRHIPWGIWLSQVNLTQPHSSIKVYFGQMSGGGVRVLVKCLSGLSIKRRVIVVLPLVVSTLRSCTRCTHQPKEQLSSRHGASV